MALMTLSPAGVGTLTTDNANTDFATVGNDLAFIIFNAAEEPIRMVISPNNALEITVHQHGLLESKHTTVPNRLVIPNGSFVIEGNTGLVVDVEAVVVDGTDTNNTVTFAVEPLHTAVGLNDELVFISELSDVQTAAL